MPPKDKKKRQRVASDSESEEEFSEKQLYFYDFTLRASGIGLDAIRNFIKGISKKWVFQLERGEGETEYEHYQGRISLFKRKRMGEVITQYKFPPIHWSATSTQGSRTFSYVMKEDTRIAGPWADTDPEPYPLTKQVKKFRENEMYPWQKTLVEMIQGWDDRRIICIYDADGCNGKTALRLHLMTAGLARSIPFCNDYRDIMRMVYDMPRSECYFIDLPRALGKDKLFQMWSACESIKDGHIFEDRYHFRDTLIDAPQLVVTTNCCPSRDLLTRDRWVIYCINDKKELKKYVPTYKEKDGETEVPGQVSGSEATQDGQTSVRVEEEESRTNSASAGPSRLSEESSC